MDDALIKSRRAFFPLECDEELLKGKSPLARKSLTDFARGEVAL